MPNSANVSRFRRLPCAGYRRCCRACFRPG